MDIHEYLKVLLSQVAKKKNWKNFDVSSDVVHESGNGFLGEFFLASVINKDDGEKVDVAVKKAFKSEARRSELNIPAAFQNEIKFYESLVPAFLNFAESKGVSGFEDLFAVCYGSNSNDFEESIIMENLRSSGYSIIGLKNYLTPEQAEFVFRTYGRYHALSFAFKDQKPEEYQKLTENLADIWTMFNDREGFRKARQIAAEASFKRVDDNVRRDCKEYLEDINRIYVNAGNYLGKYTCLAHGDCWSNNMMFKYEDSKLTDIKLIDFQLVKNDTPVHDLAYFLYAGGTKECFENIDEYLKIYHESFSKACRELGSDPEIVFPYKALLEDWKKYAKWGIIMGLMIQKMKPISAEDVKELTQDSGIEGHREIILDEETQSEYQRKIKLLIEDVYHRGLLID